MVSLAEAEAGGTGAQDTRTCSPQRHEGQLWHAVQEDQEVALHSNSVKNLILRQGLALEFFALAQKKKTFINID